MHGRDGPFPRLVRGSNEVGGLEMPKLVAACQRVKYAHFANEVQQAIVYISGQSRISNLPSDFLTLCSAKCIL